jgi:2-methylfumaryl-CoA hydratase
VYGGHVISVCRALSYEGLENALLVAAINAGTHCNPTFAGDTLYTRTQVLEKWALPGRADLGALRLRMLGLKNLTPPELAEAKVDSKYHPNVVLDLDYTVLMPRRN